MEKRFEPGPKVRDPDGQVRHDGLGQFFNRKPRDIDGFCGHLRGRIRSQQGAVHHVVVAAAAPKTAR